VNNIGYIFSIVFSPLWLSENDSTVSYYNGIWQEVQIKYRKKLYFLKYVAKFFGRGWLAGGTGAVV